MLAATTYSNFVGGVLLIIISIFVICALLCAIKFVWELLVGPSPTPDIRQGLNSQESISDDDSDLKYLRDNK
jgi:hypothetical protein